MITCHNFVTSFCSFSLKIRKFFFFWRLSWKYVIIPIHQNIFLIYLIGAHNVHINSPLQHFSKYKNYGNRWRLVHHSINSKLTGLSFLVHFILRTSAIFAVEGGFSEVSKRWEKKSLKTKHIYAKQCTKFMPSLAGCVIKWTFDMAVKENWKLAIKRTYCISF